MAKRKYKAGVARQQTFLLPPRLDEYVTADNPVRAIDAYVECLDLATLGFQHTTGEQTAGQPAFPPGALLKLYLYGYLHRVRSSRRLEAECRRNLEVIWLLHGLQPGYKTIADFRRANLAGLKQVNRDFVQVCQELDLFGGELVGIDGSFFRGNVAKASIFTAERLQRALHHIEQDIAHYWQELETADQQDEPQAGPDPELAHKLERLRTRQQHRRAQLQQLTESGESQVAEVDPDARRLNKGQGTVAGYNGQTGIDAKHKLILVGTVVQDGNDEAQLAPLAQAAKAQLGVEQLAVVADEGYYNAVQIRECEAQGITPYVPEPDKQAQVRAQGRWPQAAFTYEAQSDCYRCPAGAVLHTSTVQVKGEKRNRLYRSNPAVCVGCALKGQCLPAKTPYRTLSRWEQASSLEAHRQRMQQAGAAKLRERTKLCEHPFGTLKLWLGWTHFLLRGLAKVRAEFSLMLLAYNFRRVLSILGVEAFRSYCQQRSWLQPA